MLITGNMPVNCMVDTDAGGAPRVQCFSSETKMVVKKFILYMNVYAVSEEFQMI